MQEEKQKICKDEVIQKLFSDLGYGSEEKSFKFKISLDENFPSKLYKNRKFGLNLKLVPSSARSSKLVPNSTNYVIKQICWTSVSQFSIRMAIGPMRIQLESQWWMAKISVNYIKAKGDLQDFWLIR